LADAATLLRQALVRSPGDVPARSNLALVLLLSRQSEATIAAPQELGHSNPPPIQVVPAVAPERPNRIDAGPSRSVDSPPVGTPVVAPEVSPRYIESATTSPAIPVGPSPGTQTAPSPSATAPLPRTEASGPWSCPGICQLMHSVLDRGTAGQGQQ
jgi:hypothetical protein